MVKTRVVVALSGGVDSAVTAALLKEQGYDVIGITMQIWPVEETSIPSSTRTCCGLSAVADARRVCQQIDIPYYVLNLRDVFQKQVIHRFCREYLTGRTPNPCVLCNQHLKFDVLWRKASSLGAKYLATGHYARIEKDKPAIYRLKKAGDAKYDQSYFLYSIPQNRLPNLLMPLGYMSKSETRQRARNFNLTVADKPGSQEICFVPTELGYRKFIQQYIKHAKFIPGPIFDTTGKRIGTHKGIPFYTIGQRRGIGISSVKPYYVIALKPKENTVIVGTEPELYRTELKVTDLNFTAPDVIKLPFSVTARIRYRGTESAAIIFPDEKDMTCLKVKFTVPQRAVTPGQSIVFYQNDIVLGGGIIQ